MKGSGLLSRRCGTAVLGCLLFASLAGHSEALAADVGVTLKTTLSGSYRGTVPLTEGTAKKLAGSAINSDDTNEIAKQLAKLKDGDILVLAMHSSPKIFAVGQDTYSWEKFWSTFGIARPPRLSVAILGGCMFDHDDVKKVDIPITPKRVGELRSVLNAELIYTPRGAVNPFAASQNVFLFLESLQNNTLLKDVDLAGGWYQNVSSRWIIKGRWSTAKLDFLRRVNYASRAYEAGVDARLGRRKPEEARKEFEKEPELLKAFQLGYDHANEGDNEVRKGYEKLRDTIMGN